MASFLPRRSLVAKPVRTQQSRMDQDFDEMLSAQAQSRADATLRDIDTMLEQFEVPDYLNNENNINYTPTWVSKRTK